MENVVEVMTKINLNNGGSFIADKDMELYMRVNILNIFATCLDFGGKRCVDFKDDLFMNLPKNIVELSNKSKIYSGC